MMESMKHNNFDQMQEKATIELINMGEEKQQNKEIISAFMEELNALYASCKEWMKTNMDPEVMEPRLQKLREETEILLAKAKDKIHLITDNSEFRDRLQDGKEIVIETTSKVAHVVSEGAQEFLQQDHVKRVVDNVSQSFHSIANDERVKEGVSSLKKGTLKVAESAYIGLKKILDETTDDKK